MKNAQANLETYQSGGSLSDGTEVKTGFDDLETEIAEKYGLEPEFIAAIMALESGYGTSSLCTDCNNPGGLKASSLASSTTSSNFAIFDIIELGIEGVIKNLAGYTQYGGVEAVTMEYVDVISATYCVGGDWANKVKAIYNEIKANEGA